MSRPLHRLSARFVETTDKPGRHADGGNLYLTVSTNSTNLSKRWTFMYQFDGHQREAGLGPFHDVPLKAAREKATEYRAMLVRGIDPLAAKLAEQIAIRGRRTFGECAEELYAAKLPGFRSAIGAKTWRDSIANYCGPILNRPVETIDTDAVLVVLRPLWTRVRSTGISVRARIEKILDYAKVCERRTGDNPARWKGHLEHILTEARADVVHYPAMPYAEVPDFLARLRADKEQMVARMTPYVGETLTPRTFREQRRYETAQMRADSSMRCLAIEFAVLTAVRPGEAREARWEEIDLETKIWTIPSNRMKTRLEHRVPLSAPVIEILMELKEKHAGAGIFLFPAGMGRSGHIAKYTLLQKLWSLVGKDGATLHGFRSSFRDWCGEMTNFPRELAETCLAHSYGDATERAYRRGDALEKRRQVMEAWAAYCEPRTADTNVISINS